MVRILAMILCFLSTHARAYDVPADFSRNAYNLPSGLVLHGWSDTDYPDYRPQKVTDRHYEMDLSIVNDVREITAPAMHLVISARFRSNQSFYISGEGPTWRLTDIQTPFSAWHALPVTHNGHSVSLAPISYFGDDLPSALPRGLTLKEVFPNITPERIYAAERVYRKTGGSAVHPEYLKFCIESLDNGNFGCGPYVHQVELDLILKDALPVKITFNHIPGC